MRRVRIERKVAYRRRDDRDSAVLPLDPRDPDILRAKQLLRERGCGACKSARAD